MFIFHTIVIFANALILTVLLQRWGGAIFGVLGMLKTLLAFALVNALGMAMMIYFDKKKKRPMGSPAMYTTTYVIATALDVLIARLLL